MNKVLFVQARLKSSRFPNKMLMPLYGKPVIEHCLEQAIKIDVDRHVLLTDYDSYDILYPHAVKYGFKVFEGADEDVLNRFAEGIKYFHADVALRLTGDKVIVSYDYINGMINKFCNSKSVLLHATGQPWVQTTAGVFDAKTLLTLDENENLSQYDREHIKPYIVENYKEIITITDDLGYNWPKELKLTIDTVEDYLFLRKMFHDFGETPQDVGDILDWYNNEYGSTT